MQCICKCAHNNKWIIERNEVNVSKKCYLLCVKLNWVEMLIVFFLLEFTKSVKNNNKKWLKRIHWHRKKMGWCVTKFIFAFNRLCESVICFLKLPTPECFSLEYRFVRFRHSKWLHLSRAMNEFQSHDIFDALYLAAEWNYCHDMSLFLMSIIIFRLFNETLNV